MSVRSKIHGSPVTSLELLLWLFALGWLRVALDPSPLSIVGRVLTPAGAGHLAAPVVGALVALGILGIFGCKLWCRRAFLVLSAGWWTLVWLLIYLKATPVVTAHWWASYVPTDSGAYSYALIGLICIIEAVSVTRKDRTCAP